MSPAMELSLSGGALKTLARSITCLARVGSELVFQASPSQLALHTLNSSRSAYQSITFKHDCFDSFSVVAVSAPASGDAPIQCSVLLKSVCAVFRTPVAAIDRLTLILPSPDAPKLHFSLNCFNGVRKVYGITCNVEPDVQRLSLDRARFPSSLAVRPRDLARLLANFQSSLQEITIIATEPSAAPPASGDDVGGKAVELRSYIDPTKDNSDTALHTQLWIDPAEEFLQYTHSGDAVDVTFGVKELKAFLTFCEGCEVDISIYFEKAGEPILMAPRFGFDDGSCSDFDASLVLATMLTSQLNDHNVADDTAAVPRSCDQVPTGMNAGSQGARAVRPSQISDLPSNHTKIWSELSGSAAKSLNGTGSNVGHAQAAGNPLANTQNDMRGPHQMNASKAPLAHEGTPPPSYTRWRPPEEAACLDGLEGAAGADRIDRLQRHPSNWVGDDDDEDDDEDLCVQTTPTYHD